MATVIELRPDDRAPDAFDELYRLRQENRRLAVTLGAFSAFLAGRGLLEEAWHYVHQIHEIEEGSSPR
jgi:hypothetical protein